MQDGKANLYNNFVPISHNCKGFVKDLNKGPGFGQLDQKQGLARLRGCANEILQEE